METKQLQRLRGAIGRTIACIRLKPEHQVTKACACRVVLWYFNPFNGNGVSMVVCWALFAVWFSLGFLLIPLTSASTAIDNLAVSVLSSAITHLVGFILIGKTILAFLSPLLVLASPDDQATRGISIDFRLMIGLVVLGLVGNAIGLVIAASEVERNFHSGMLLPYVSFPVLMFIWMLISLPYFIFAPISAMVMQVLGILIHEYRVGWKS